MKAKGCSTLILLHDLDDRQREELSFEICNTLSKCSIPKHIVVIPIREIEAWLLSDSAAIKKGMNLEKNVSRIADPQSVINPKRKLGEIVYLQSGKSKRYLNSAHNRKIAAELDLGNVRRCASFLPLEKFVIENIK